MDVLALNTQPRQRLAGLTPISDPVPNFLVLRSGHGLGHCHSMASLVRRTYLAASPGSERQLLWSKRHDDDDRYGVAQQGMMDISCVLRSLESTTSTRYRVRVMLTYHTEVSRSNTRSYGFVLGSAEPLGSQVNT